jgi:hypothetical protein
MANVQASNKDAFISKANEDFIERLLVKDFNRRIGGELNSQQKVALEKRIKYYMGKIHNDAQITDKSVQGLNKAVLQAVVPDYISYLNRPTRPSGEEDMEKIRNDVSSRFDSMQQERQENGKPVPPAPKFQLSIEDNYPPSLSRLEELKKQREQEAYRYDPSMNEPRMSPEEISRKQGADDMMKRMSSDDLFRESSKEFAANDAVALALRDSARTNRFNNSANQIVDIAPDPRRAFFGENETAVFGTRAQGLPTANPTLVLPEGIRNRPPLPQDIIKPQSDVVSYRDNEYNLFIYSADRDWVNNTTENRYNFSINFDPANNRSGFGLSPSTYIKFKNIVRIELVKVIMPTEGIDTISRKTSPGTYNTDGNINVFSYPYLQVRIDELNTNGFGTNDGLNNAFGVVSYDAYWASDSSLKNRGYTRLIPKFLKCQKVYYPTPLSTLQKMTIQIQKPDGTLLSNGADAIDVSGIVTSAMLGTGGPPPTTAISPWEPAGSTVNVANTDYYDTSGEHIWVQTKTWFSQFAVTQGDRIVFSNVVLPSTFSPQGPASADFLNYINRPEGHIVVDIAEVVLSASSEFIFRTGSNALGYSNFIIIRNKFNDPSTGSISLLQYGGNSTLNNAFMDALMVSPAVASGRLLNLSHQIQLIFRVITRDMDSATRLRPDNL